MRRFIASAIIAVGMTAAMSSSALAWACRATSPTSFGVGWNYYRAIAAQRALAECAVRTPRGLVCRLRWCRP